MNFKSLATKDLFLLVSGILGGIFIKGLWNLIVFGVIIYLIAQFMNFIGTRGNPSSTKSNRY